MWLFLTQLLERTRVRYVQPFGVVLLCFQTSLQVFTMYATRQIQLKRLVVSFRNGMAFASGQPPMKKYMIQLYWHIVWKVVYLFPPSFRRNVWAWIDVFMLPLSWLNLFQLVDVDDHSASRLKTTKAITLFATVFVWLKMLALLKDIFEPFSKFICALEQCIVDMLPFMTVLLIMMIMFMHLFFIIEHFNNDTAPEEEVEPLYYIDDGPDNILSATQQIMLLFFGTFDDDIGRYASGAEKEQDAIVFFLFMFIMILIMQNLLIAVVCDSYAESMEAADTLVWKAYLVMLNKGTVMIEEVKNIRNLFSRTLGIDPTNTDKEKKNSGAFKVFTWLFGQVAIEDIFDEEVGKMTKKDPTRIRIKSLSDLVWKLHRDEKKEEAIHDQMVKDRFDHLQQKLLLEFEEAIHDE
uniref:Ion transport domain-containing protein n=2 Tax=Octactis speculum TaxID=3111310 RepID=A0A7S2DFG1_9STRA